MTQIASLPQLTVNIAFNPTDLKSLTQNWTDVTAYVRDFQTMLGRQHFLDRIESGSLNMTLDNRDGFLYNGTYNGTGKSIRVRLPIQIIATWNTIDYPVYFGYIDSLDPQVGDVLNLDLTLSAKDALKFLSLYNLYDPNLYYTVGVEYGNTHAQTLYWWPTTANTNSTSFYDSTGSALATVIGSVSFTQQGVCVYSNNTCIDLSDGGSTGVGTIYIGSSQIEFWATLPQVTNTNLTNGLASSVLYPLTCDLYVTSEGTVGWRANSVTHPTVVNDGLWHHISLIDDGISHTQLVVDGVAVDLGVVAYLNGNCQIGPFAGYVDQILIQTGLMANQVKDAKTRYRLGSLLQTKKLAGDRIAEALYLAGYGSIDVGVLSVPNYWVNNLAYVDGASTNGTTYCQSGLSGNSTTSTALDVILTAAETETGAFYQSPDGYFQFHTLAYPYLPASPGFNQQYVMSDETYGQYHYDGPSLRLIQDDVDLWTRVIVTPQNGLDQIYESGNDALYGSSTLNKTGTYHSTNAEALNTAQYLGYIYSTPLTRADNVVLRSETNNGTQLPAMLGTDIGDQVKLIRRPTNAPAISGNYLVEQISHNFQAYPGTWATALVLDPFPLRIVNQDSTEYLVLDDATYGKLDSNLRLL